MPGISAQIKRPETIMLKYHDVEQKNHESYFSGLNSRLRQHELDHLEGMIIFHKLKVC